MDQQVAIVLGADREGFYALISQLMSSANELRSQAEALFNLCRERHPDALAIKLAKVPHYPQYLEIRAMSAVLLRKQVTSSSSSYIWSRLTPATQNYIKFFLLDAVQYEETKSITKKLCDTVSELASNLLPDDAWPELLPYMFGYVISDSPRLQESALLIFSQLAQYIGDILLPRLPTLHSVFLYSLSHSMSSDVRIAALGASINFIQCLESATDRELFQDLLPAMMKTLTEALNSGNEATAQEALELLIELAGTEPIFLGRQLVEVVSSMLQIAEADRLEEVTRHLAVEFVITLAEARERAPGMLRRLPQFIERLVAVLMKMLLDIEDEDAGETSNYSVGRECLDRLSIALGGNTIFPVASQLLPQYLAGQEWKKRHAALITLAQIAEGCSNVMVNNLEKIVSMVLNSFGDPHPRVRWAAINAIGQLFTDLGPVLQFHYHQQVLPALASALDDFQNPRVQAHAASAVVNFIEKWLFYISLPDDFDEIVSKLNGLRQNEKQMVREAALTALASIAGVRHVDLF